MDKVRTLIVGAGITGLAAAAFCARPGLPRPRGATARSAATARRSSRTGFVWDYSGHFFHFKHPEIEAWLRARMPGQDVRTVAKRVVHRLRRAAASTSRSRRTSTSCRRTEFIDCLYDLYFARRTARRVPGADADELQGDALRALRASDRREVPHPVQREALRAAISATLDKDAMGRFFPHADLDRHHPQHEGRRQRAATTRRSPIPRAARSST